MQINHVTNYAIKAMIYMATIGHAVSSQEIAEATQVSRALLVNILGKLKKGGLVASERGITGGYSLARDPGRISLMDVIRCMEKTVYINWCLEPGSQSNMASDPHFSYAYEYFDRVQTALESSMNAMTLDKLVNADYCALGQWVGVEEVC